MTKIVREPKWSRGHVVLVRPGSDQRVKKIVQEPNWSRSSPSVIMVESENGNRGTMTPPQHVSLRFETRMTIGSLPETLQMTTLPSSPCPQHLEPTHYIWLQRISTCIFLDIVLCEACVFHCMYSIICMCV